MIARGFRLPTVGRLVRAAVIAVTGLLLLGYVLGPIYWVFSSSVTAESALVSKPIRFVPDDPSLRNFRAIFLYAEEKVTYDTRRQSDPSAGEFVPSAAQNLMPAMWNSLYVGVWVAVLNVVFSLTAAYAIARIRFRARNAALFAILTTRVIPDIALAVPLFLVMRNLGLIDTREALIVTYLAVTLPFTVFILINYFESIPNDLDRAARIDGCTHLQVLWHVFLPLGMPAIVASLLFAFLSSWNEFVLALMTTKTMAAQTLPIVISGFVFDFTTSFSFINAAGVVAIVPPVVLAIAFERYIVGGLSAGAVKG